MSLLVAKFKLVSKIVLYCMLFAVTSCCAKFKKNNTHQILIQACPEEWIKNKMPSPPIKEASEYFIYQGNRRELKEFDLEWIKINCNIKPQIVQ
jgi:hypothetical protein